MARAHTITIQMQVEPVTVTLEQEPHCRPRFAKHGIGATRTFWVDRLASLGQSSAHLESIALWGERAPVANILSVSYLPSLLETREQLLKSQGYTVTSARELTAALRACKSSRPFQLLIVGHSIPQSDKHLLIEAFRGNQPNAAIVALKRLGEEPPPGADLVIEPDPRELLRSVADLISGRRTSA